MPRLISNDSFRFSPTQPRAGQEASLYSYQEFSRLSSLLTSSLDELRKKIDGISSQDGGSVSNEELENRVNSLESQTALLSLSVQSLQTQINGLQYGEQIASLSTQLQAVQALLADVKASVDLVVSRWNPFTVFEEVPIGFTFPAFTLTEWLLDAPMLLNSTGRTVTLRVEALAIPFDLVIENPTIDPTNGKVRVRIRNSTAADITTTEVITLFACLSQTLV